MRKEDHGHCQKSFYQSMLEPSPSLFLEKNRKLRVVSIENLRPATPKEGLVHKVQEGIDYVHEFLFELTNNVSGNKEVEKEHQSYQRNDRNRNRNAAFFQEDGP